MHLKFPLPRRWVPWNLLLTGSERLFTPAKSPTVVRGNPVGIRDCPAAVSGNESRIAALT
jgi:hypothetical protein